MRREETAEAHVTALRPEPIGRTALAVEIANRLRQMIFEGVLAPGEKINERALTESFGVSRTPLREALKVLANEGLLDLIPHRGAVITRQSEAELGEVFRVLAALEGLAGELAAENAPQDALDEIASLTAELRASYEAADRPLYFEINQAIHKAILSATGNETLQRTHELVAFRAQRARYQANLTPERWRAAVEEHEAIAAALAMRDAERAGALMKQHLLRKFAVIRTQF